MKWWHKLTGKVTRREFEALERKVDKLMATVDTEIAKANEKITALEARADLQETALGGVTDDVAYLKEQLAAVGSGELNPAQQAAFDAMNTRLDAMNTRQEKFTTDIQALDSTTSRT